MSDERRKSPRVPFTREVRVGRLSDLKPMLARDLSEGGVFITGCDCQVGEEALLEFEAEEIPGVKVRAHAVVVRRIEGEGVGLRFERFEEGGVALARLIKFMLDPSGSGSQ